MSQKWEKNSNLTESIVHSTALNYGFRGIAILLGLVYAKLVLSYLGHTLYGLWATISSIAAWVNYGDLGIGNGLRNHLAAAVAENDKIKQKRLVVTAGKTLSVLAVCMFLLLLVISELMFKTNILNPMLRTPMLITNFFFCSDLLLGVGRSVSYGLQMSWLTTLAQTSTVVFRVILIKLLISFKVESSLTVFAVGNGICGFLANLFLVCALIPKLGWKKTDRIQNYFYPEYQKKIVSLGMSFFIIQISCLVLYSTDNLIINKYISSIAVTEYSFITKIYSTGESLFSIVLISLWSATTYAMAKQDYSWIRASVKKIVLFWLLFICGVVFVSVNLNWIMRIWLKEDAIFYDASVIWLFAMYTITRTFGSIFVYVTNGLGRLKIQLYASIIEAMVNIPLSIFLAVNCDMGIIGVKLATWICCFSSNVLIPIDIIRYLWFPKRQITRE